MVGLEFPFLWFLKSRDVPGQELQFLRHAPPGDGVVLIQAHSHRLTVQNIFAHVCLDEAVNFLPGRRSIPASFPLTDKGINAIAIDVNGSVTKIFVRRAKHSIRAVNARADQQKLDKRLSKKPG